MSDIRLYTTIRIPVVLRNEIKLLAKENGVLLQEQIRIMTKYWDNSGIPKEELCQKN